MKFIEINKNTLVNPFFISCIEQKKKYEKTIVTVYVGENGYELDDATPKRIKQLMDDIEKIPTPGQQQFFAG